MDHHDSTKKRRHKKMMPTCFASITYVLYAVASNGRSICFGH